MDAKLTPKRSVLGRAKDAISRQLSSERVGLHVLRDPANAEIDIVAVHGLGGKGFRSWITRDPKSGSAKPWLEELLAADIPNARIMTYRYISRELSYASIVQNLLVGSAKNLAFSLAALRNQDGANRRPLFFLAHSLGGWVVKRVLILSHESAESQLQDIEASTCGVAFFGTIAPGKPSSPSPLAHVVRRTSTLTDTNKRMESSMDFNGSGSIEQLEKQMGAFKAIASNLPRLSFYETKKGEDGFVAEKKHAVTSSDGSRVALAATHSDLVTFNGRDDNYHAFLSKFSQMIDKKRIKTLLESKRKETALPNPNREEYRKYGFSLQYELPEDPHSTVVRSEILRQIGLVCNADEGDPTLRIAVLTGAHGSGKTAMAKHFAKTNKDLSFVFWIRSESWETVATSYLQFADDIASHYAKNIPRNRVEEELGLTGIQDMLKMKNPMDLDRTRIMSVVRGVNDWMVQSGNDKWLVVFDHVVPSYDIMPFIPLSLHGKIIMTTIDRDTCLMGTNITLGPMSEDESVELLRLDAGQFTANNLQQDEAVRALVKQLGYNPLLISTAASTIRSRNITVVDYLAGIEAKNTPTLFGSTIDQSPVTRTFLKVSSMLSLAAIPASLFAVPWETDHATTEISDLIRQMRQYQNQSGLDDVIQHLLNSNFIQIAPSPDSTPPSSPRSIVTTRSATTVDYFFVDKDAREHIRDTMSIDETVQNSWLACNLCVNGIRDNNLDASSLPEIHSFGRVMLPHARTCYDDWAGVLENPPDEVAWHVLGNVCMIQGALKQAIGCFELALRQNSSTMTTVERIQTSISLARLLEQEGNGERSLEVLTSIDIASIDQALGFQVSRAKASANASCGHLDRAEDQFENLEHEQEQVLGAAHAETVGTVQMLAATLERLQRLEDAQTLYRRVYLSYQKTFGQSHPMTLGSLDALANISKALLATNEAETLYKLSVEIKTRCLGPDHPRTAFAMQNVATIEDVLGRYGDARQKFTAALAIMQDTLGPLHPHYTLTAHNFARCLYHHAQVLGNNTPMSSSLNAAEFHAQNSARRTHTPADGVMRETARRRALMESEKRYLEVLNNMRKAKGIYQYGQLVKVGRELYQLYDSEEMFALHRFEKIESMWDIVEGSKRRNTIS